MFNRTKASNLFLLEIKFIDQIIYFIKTNLRAQVLIHCDIDLLFYLICHAYTRPKIPNDSFIQISIIRMPIRQNLIPKAAFYFRYTDFKFSGSLNLIFKFSV